MRFFAKYSVLITGLSKNLKKTLKEVFWRFQAQISLWLQDYRELTMPLSDIPVNPYTASELVRLCLRKNDSDPDDSSNSSEDSEEENEEDDVVRRVVYVFFLQCDSRSVVI